MSKVFDKPMESEKNLNALVQLLARLAAKRWKNQNPLDASIRVTAKRKKGKGAKKNSGEKDD